MDNSTCGDVTQRQVVAGLDICLCTCLNNISLPYTLRGNDIALLAICIMQERDAGRPVRIIFDLSNFCWYAIFIPPLEINKEVLALVSAATVAACHTAVTVTTAGLAEFTQQRLLRGGTRDL